MKTYYRNETKIKFPKIKSAGKRPWGEEKILAIIPKKSL